LSSSLLAIYQALLPSVINPINSIFFSGKINNEYISSLGANFGTEKNG